MRSRAEKFRSLAGGRCEVDANFLKLLERKEIDAVSVAVSGHWHCLPVLHACAAGKHVYAEKPLAWSIGEGRAMVKAARKYNRIVFFGAQQRHMPHYQEAVELIHSGRLGKISRVHAWNFENLSPNGYGKPPDGDPPADLDWEFYLGPAPKASYNPNRFFHHYWFWDYGGGWQSEWAVHMNDVMRWAMKAGTPRSVVASGGKWVRDDNTELPDTLEVFFEYPDFLYTYSFRHGNARHFEGSWYGNIFYGENGTLVICREFWALYPEFHGPDQPRIKPIERSPGRGEFHQRAFIESLRAGKPAPGCDVEEGHYSSILGHLANISYRTGRRIEWDAEREQVRNDEAANKLVTRVYREPWKLEV
jgi:predicted dehydrogenase